MADDGGWRWAASGLPRRAQRGTPGDVFPNVSVDAICTPGYAGSVRHVTAIIRQQVFTAYGLTGKHTGYCDGPQGCELDHLISLELGESNDPKNLWPESYDSQPWNAHVKDHLENTLHALVYSGKVPLVEAQQAIASDWIGSYVLYGKSRDPRLAYGRLSSAATLITHQSAI